MTDAQRHLFALPRSEQFKLSIEQRRVLDWVAYNEGRVAAWPIKLSKTSLRRLMVRKLIRCIALSPACYMLTELGRMVRGQRTIRHAMAAGRE